jgi:hypothetical protein
MEVVMVVMVDGGGRGREVVDVELEAAIARRRAKELTWSMHVLWNLLP